MRSYLKTLVTESIGSAAENLAVSARGSKRNMGPGEPRRAGSDYVDERWHDRPWPDEALAAGAVAGIGAGEGRYAAPADGQVNLRLLEPDPRVSPHRASLEPRVLSSAGLSVPAYLRGIGSPAGVRRA